jgi:hypothetical protein
MTISSSAERSPHHLSLSLGMLLANPPYLVLALSTAATLLLTYLLIFLQSTTFAVFFIRSGSSL